MPRHIAIVYNARSGALAGLDPSGATIPAKLEERGVVSTVLAFDPMTLRAGIETLLSTAPDALWVAGGDGTVLAVVKAVGERVIPIGVIPGGTMNVLARDLGIPADLDRALEALLDAPVERIDVALVNGAPFLCSSILGVMSHLGRVRETTRGVAKWRSWPGALLRAASLLRRHPHMKLDLTVDGVRQRLRTRAVAISNNPLSAGTGGMPSRPALNTGQLALYISRDESRWDMVQLAAGIADGSWQSGDIECWHARDIRISVDGLGLISAMSDGELQHLETPLHYTITPGALSMLRPKALS